MKNVQLGTMSESDYDQLSQFLDQFHHEQAMNLEIMDGFFAALVLRPRPNLIRLHGVLAPNAKLRAEIIPGGQKNESNSSDANDGAPHSSASVRISWVRLLKRAFEIDIEHCPHCSGTMKIIAAILESSVITKMHLNL